MMINEFPLYATCACCGRRWNVSQLPKEGYVYICPECELKKKRKVRHRKRKGARD